ncbi:MAG: hypothetical protein ACHQD8_01400 [Chitinophagales bacterium]
MSTKTIPFIPNENGKTIKTTIESYCEGAWSFANTVLWPEQSFPKDELQLALQYIRHYFELARDKKKAFVAFCERIILTKRYITAQPGRFLPAPSVWFNYYYAHGFTGTKSWLEQIQAKRKDIPGYLQHISTVAEYYLLYIQRPSAKTFNSCRKKLLALKAYSLLQFFYNAILHFSYIKL